MKRLVILILVVSCFGCLHQEQTGRVRLHANEASLSRVNGVLFYKKAPFTGTLFSEDQINGTKNQTEYLDGKLHGLETKYYHNNQLAEVRWYENGLKVGVHKGYWQNGTQKFEYNYNRNGMYDGEFKEWYTNGQLVKKFHYVNGLEDGSQQMWLMNGNIRANYVVKNGERFGLIGLKKCFTVNTKENEEI